MDNYIVSARKYRPSTFRSVVGQKSLTTTLKNAIQNNKLAHAYLFCGPRGVGKTSCARIFAKTINCLQPTADGEACNACESCVAFNEQRSYNIHELDAASNNSVDDIRSLIEKVRIPPAIGKYKVFIIDEVHMLSPAAFNAFLKTLEEPPAHALFILATTEKHKVLATILSRCQIYDFSRISIADIVDHLQYVTEQEHAVAEAEALNVIAQKADGGMRDALSIFDQVLSYTNGNITYQAVIDNLNVLDYEYYFRLTDALLNGQVRAAVLILNDILNKGFDGQHIITGLASHFRDLMVCKDPATLVLFEVGASIRERYIEMAQRCSDPFLYKAIELTNECDLNYRISRNKRLLMELTLIRLCQLSTPVAEDKKKTLIEPIAPTQPQQTPTAAGQPATAPQQPANAATATQPTHRVTTQVAHTHPVATPSTSPSSSPKKRGRMPINTSLKDLGKEKNGPQQQAGQDATAEVVTPFTEEQMIVAWNEFAETMNERAQFKNTLLNNRPQLGADHCLEIKVHNPGQQTELLDEAVSILSFMRDRLKNTRIQLSVSIDETNERKHAYTSVEKYDYLLEVNESLARLREEFNLKLD